MSEPTAQPASLNNQLLSLSFHPQAGFTVHSQQDDSLRLEGSRILVALRRNGLPLQVDPLLLQPEGECAPVELPCGPARQLDLAPRRAASGVVCQASFALPERLPLLLWKVRVQNQGDTPVCIERIELLSAGTPRSSKMVNTSHQSSIHLGRAGIDGSALAFFSNGWQSWNYSGAYAATARYRRTRLGPVAAPMRVNGLTRQPLSRGHMLSEMFAVLGDRRQRNAILAGFLSQQNHFGSLEAWIDRPHPTLRMWAHGDGARLDPGNQVETDWACLGFLHLDNPDPLAPYLEAVAAMHRLPADIEDRPVPTGWCSWYHFYERVTAEDVRANLQAAARLRPEIPLDLIQVDDGFQTFYGDWYDIKPSFPQGMASLAAEIHAAGFTPGLWLAPFMVESRSQLACQHPDWLLRNARGKPVNAGFLPGHGFTTALDLTQPEALEYAAGVVDTAVHTWGYPYLKLDFLYTAALPGQYRDPTKTRAQVLRLGLQALRQAAGSEAVLLGCGCPLGPAIGLVDAMRIGADVSNRWLPSHNGIELYVQSEPDMPSARNALQNTLTRLPLHRRWWINDPDALVLRPEIKLAEAEVQTLATAIALSGGAFLLSDSLPDLPSERLRLIQRLLPPIRLRPEVLDWLDSPAQRRMRPQALDWFDSPTPRHLRLDLANPCGEFHLLALFNWDDTPVEETLRVTDVGMPLDQVYFAREFWSGKCMRTAGGALPGLLVPPHGVALLALRPAAAVKPAYLGSDLHISQGLEVTSWEYDGKRLLLSLERPGRASGSVDLHLPRIPRSAAVNHRQVHWQVVGEDVYRFHLQFEQQAAVDIRW